MFWLLDIKEEKISPFPLTDSNFSAIVNSKLVEKYFVLKSRKQIDPASIISEKVEYVDVPDLNNPFACLNFFPNHGLVDLSILDSDSLE